MFTTARPVAGKASAATASTVSIATESQSARICGRAPLLMFPSLVA
jgi:hypothetical protein